MSGKQSVAGRTVNCTHLLEQEELVEKPRSLQSKPPQQNQEVASVGVAMTESTIATLPPSDHPEECPNNYSLS